MNHRRFLNCSIVSKSIQLLLEKKIDCSNSRIRLIGDIHGFNIPIGKPMNKMTWMFFFHNNPHRFEIKET